MQENGGRERVAENAFEEAPSQLLFLAWIASTAVHFPRRLISRARQPFRVIAVTSARSCVRKTPDKMRQPSGARCRNQTGNATIRISLKRLAVMMSNFPAIRDFRTSPVRNSKFRTRLARAF